MYIGLPEIFRLVLKSVLFQEFGQNLNAVKFQVEMLRSAFQSWAISEYPERSVMVENTKSLTTGGMGSESWYLSFQSEWNTDYTAPDLVLIYCSTSKLSLPEIHVVRM